MPVRITPDENQPSATIEIPLEKPLPDYDLEQLEQPTPRDVDSVLVTQGFRDLVDDARGVLLDLIADYFPRKEGQSDCELDLGEIPLEVAQLTGAICPGPDESYLPGLWIVLRDKHAPAKSHLSARALERIAAITDEFVRRLQLE